jgi:hypothetical protein
MRLLSLHCRTDRVQHRINTGNVNAIRHPPRQLPLGKRDIETTEIDQMLKRGVIEPRAHGDS